MSRELGDLVGQERRGMRGVAGGRLESSLGPGCEDLERQPRPRPHFTMRCLGSVGIKLLPPFLPLFMESTF